MTHQVLAIVTGASSGIGRATALQLAARGYHVLAGARRPAETDLAENERIEVVPLDITDARDIEQLARRVSSEDHRHLVLVNNAGVSLNSLVELTPLATWRSQFETNLFGHIAVTQALLPALVGAPASRIVNVSSSGVLLTSPMLGVYAAAKAGLEKASDALRRELAAQRTKVVVVQPGAVRTGIWEKARSVEGAGQDEHMTTDQSLRYQALVEAVAAQADRFASAGTDVETAARVILRAVTARRPRAYYRIGNDARMMNVLSRTVPHSIQDRIVARIVGARTNTDERRTCLSGVGAEADPRNTKAG